jgi:L-alanine-DL-glutamate epimerase-like enolase superfamily enzyme
VKIESVKVHARVLKRADPEWRTSSYKADELGGVYVTIEAGGRAGTGASASHPRRITTEELTAQLRDGVAPALTGRPLVEARRAVAGLPAPLHSRAAIAVDLALHDLTGQLAGLPAELLWGGLVRDRVNLVRMVGLKEPEEVVAAVRPTYEQGVRAFKVKVGDGAQRDIDRVRRLARAYPDVRLMIDANGAYDLDSALELCRGLADFDVLCVEQPIAYRDTDAMAQLREKSPVPLMADQMVESVADAVRVGRQRAADIVSLKLTKMGSIAECLRVAHVCAAMGMGVHLGGCAAPGIVDSAITRLALSTPEIDAYAEAGESAALVDDQVSGVVFDGAFATSDGRPGLGGVAPQFAS